MLAGGGTGIAPLIALADEALASEIHVTLLSAGKNEAALYPKELIQPELEYVPVTEDGSVGKQGLVTAHLLPYLENADQLFLCGPVPMYKSALPVCKEAKIGDRTQLLFEVRMACGIRDMLRVLHTNIKRDEEDMHGRPQVRAERSRLGSIIGTGAITLRLISMVYTTKPKLETEVRGRRHRPDPAPRTGGLRLERLFPVLYW